MLKIDCKGKRTVGKANKGINVEKIIIGLKNLKRGEKEKEENSTELQKPSVEAEVYNNNKKCEWGKRKQLLKNLIGFIRANKIDNRGWGGEGDWEKKIQMNLQKKSKNKNNTCFSLVTASRVLSHTRNHSPPYLTMMPCNTVLICEPAVGLLRF